MSTSAHKNDKTAFARFVECVYQEKVTTDVALAMPCPVPRQRVVQPFRWQWPVVGDERRHSFLQAVHIVPSRVREAYPVFEKVLGVV